MCVLMKSALQSSVDVAFWSDLANFKLNTLKLSEAPVPIQGKFTGAASQRNAMCRGG